MNELQPQYIKWLEKNKLEVEIVLSLATVIVSSVTKREEVLILAMLSLGGFYFIDALFFGRYEWNVNAVSTKLFSLGTTLFITGLVPPLLSFSIGKIYIIIGIILTSFSGILLLVYRCIKMYHLLRLVTISFLAVLIFDRYEGLFFRNF